MIASDKIYDERQLANETTREYLNMLFHFLKNAKYSLHSIQLAVLKITSGPFYGGVCWVFFHSLEIKISRLGTEIHTVVIIDHTTIYLSRVHTHTHTHTRSTCEIIRPCLQGQTIHETELKGRHTAYRLSLVNGIN